MIKNFLLMAAMVSTVALGACENMQNAGTKETFGTVIGAVAGGYAGSKIGGGSGQLIATGLGTLAGAWLGNEVGKSLDKADYNYARQAEQQAHSAPLGETISWNNPESGNYGSVTPVRDGQTESGSYCREYEQTIYIDGQAQTGVGVACEQPDGSWKIMS